VPSSSEKRDLHRLGVEQPGTFPKRCQIFL
jgi:hypothetical protein